MRALFLWLFGATLALAAGGERLGLSREVGAIYLEDFLAHGEKAVLKVIHPAPIFYQLDGKRRLGTLVPGVEAEIIAVGESAYKVRTKATHDRVSGWVTPNALESHNRTEFVRILKELQERQVLVNKLIEQKKVALGMTAQEVRRSLGEPDRVSSLVDQTGRRESLEFICYERVAQTTTAFDVFGRPYQTVTWIKVETGKTVVELLNNAVTSIQNTEGSPNLSSPVTIAPPPILVF